MHHNSIRSHSDFESQHAGNVSPYSTGLPGASLTSTSIDPQTEVVPALWDEEELMFDDIANPPKGKGKEKDVGLKAYQVVRVICITHFKFWT